MTGPGNYSFTGVINGVALKVLIKHANASAYTFEAAADTNLTGIGNPALVTLTVGNDTGTTVVPF